MGTGALAAAPVASSAEPVPPSSVTVVSEPGDRIGQGESRLWRTGAGEINVAGSVDGRVEVGVDGGTSGDFFSLVFAAPEGEQLTTGTYEGADDAYEQRPGRAGIHVSGAGRGCDGVGDFEVLDIAPDLSRFWIVYEFRCPGWAGSLFGEVRHQVPDADALQAVPQRVSWPDQTPDTRGRAVPVTFLNTGTTALTGLTAEVEGDAFTVEDSDCATLAPGEDCTVHAGFSPDGVAAYDGTLRLSADGGTVQEVTLAGEGEPGTSTWRMHSSPGDPVGRARDYDYDATNAFIHVDGVPTQLGARLESGSDWWYANFRAAEGEVLVEGTTYEDATSYDAGDSDPRAGIGVRGNGVSCQGQTGSFTIDHAVYEDGRIQELQVSFEQWCPGAEGALRGRIQWQVGRGEGTPPADDPPGPVNDLRASSLIDAAVLRWTDPTVQDFSHTVVVHRPGSVPPVDFDPREVAYEGDDESALVTGFEAGRDQAFSVYPVDHAGLTGDPRTLVLRATDLTLRAPARVDDRDRIRLRGRLVRATSGDPVAGAEVILYARPRSGPWRAVGVMSTGERGRYSLSRSQQRWQEYSARFAGASTDLGEVSGREVVRVRR